ncbi:hypothetical protein F5Y16DRAFT_422113 [Xylariaceae sp. FL0255]|nr:hypothetical protein F5Y16DRAFT_422113 [Xylariaceae sp. FL0255]
MARRADKNTERIQLMGLCLAPEDELVVYYTARTAVERGLVLGYAIWYIAQNPIAQQAICDELAAHGIEMKPSCQDSSFEELAHANITAKLDSLPYLRAVINESLRIRPTSIPLPRVTPHRKVSSVAGVNNIPPGTRINAFQ